MKWKPELCRGLSGLGFPKVGGTFWCPDARDYNALGSILVFPCFGKLQYNPYITLYIVASISFSMIFSI